MLVHHSVVELTTPGILFILAPMIVLLEMEYVTHDLYGLQNSSNVIPIIWATFGMISGSRFASTSLCVGTHGSWHTFLLAPMIVLFLFGNGL